MCEELIWDKKHWIPNNKNYLFERDTDTCNAGSVYMRLKPKTYWIIKWTCTVILQEYKYLEKILS